MMTKLTAFKRGLVTMITVLAVATGLGLAAEPASAGARFSDNTEAYVLLGCQTNSWGLRGMRGGTLTINVWGQPTYFKLWVWDQASGYQAYWGNWEPVYYDTVPRAVGIDFSGGWMYRWVYVMYGRYVNGGWEQYGEWLTLRNPPGSSSCYL
jgi:hypothetical protein